MNRANKLTALLPALVTWTAMGTLGSTTVALGDDAPPASSDGPNGRHHNPAWAACKKQADDRKLEPGDARKEFMKTCIQSAKKAAPATS
jgi:psiF repeat